MPYATVRLRCPECHDVDALECAITCIRGDVNVAILSQTCECDPYADFDDVWEQARNIALDGDLD